MADLPPKYLCCHLQLSCKEWRKVHSWHWYKKLNFWKYWKLEVKSFWGWDRRYPLEPSYPLLQHPLYVHFCQHQKMSSSHRTSNNYYDNQRDDLMDTDDVPSSEQSDVVSMVSEIATDTDVTSSEDDSNHDSSSTDYSLSMDDVPQSTSVSSNCSDSSNSSNSPEDSHEEMQPRNADQCWQLNSQDHRDFRWDSLEHGQREPLCIECKLNRFIKVQTKVKCLLQFRRSISEIIKIMQ